ncbi:MAG: GGDEF domain-containing protein [Pseudomonas sp.]
MALRQPANHDESNAMNLHWLLSSPIVSLALLALLLMATGGCILLYLRNKRLGIERDEAIAVSEMRQLQLRKVTNTDQLTGLFNRPRLTEVAQTEIARCRRYGHPLSVICMDIDHLNEINRSYGDKVGDSVLAGLARMTQGLIRQSDAVCRWNGGAFLLLLPHTTLEQALELGEKLRKKTTASNLLVDTPVTVSVGTACLSTKESFESLTRRAENALAQAKTEGRDRSLGHHSHEVAEQLAQDGTTP